MKDIVTNLTGVVNEIDVRGQALVDLIKQYVKFASAFYGFKSLGSHPDIQFPVLFVEPKGEKPQMSTTGKYTIRCQYAIYWYVRDNDPKGVIASSSFIGECLIKLLSNNALNDIGVANPPSGKFRQYPNPGGGYYWLDSEMSDVKWSVNYLDPKADGVRYERYGRMLFEIMDVILK